MQLLVVQSPTNVPLPSSNLFNMPVCSVSNFLTSPSPVQGMYQTNNECSSTNYSVYPTNTKNAKDGEVVDCPVSCDGTWQRFGFSSLNGCVAAASIKTMKVLDAEPPSRSCKSCKYHSHLDPNSVEFKRGKADHKC